MSSDVSGQANIDHQMKDAVRPKFPANPARLAARQHAPARRAHNQLF